jgi:glutamate racemase
LEVMADARPVGVYDSGIGGLTVLRELRRLLPNESFVYLADNAHFPYGQRPLSDVRRLAREATDILLAERCKLIVIACNTASGAAVKSLRAAYDVPFVAMVPGVKPAVLSTRSGRVVVLATEGALRAELYSDVMRDFGGHAEVQTIPGTELIRRIEDAQLDDIERVIRGYLDGPLDAGADQVVLGCTHYGFVRDQVEAICAGRATVVDTATPVAEQAARVLEACDLLGDAGGGGSLVVLATGEVARVVEAARSLGLEPAAGRQAGAPQAAPAGT